MQEDSNRAGGCFPVCLYIYDLSNGLASSMSMPLVGKQIDGIWHTSIVVYNTEYFFGGGIGRESPPGSTIYGRPVNEHSLGETSIPKEVFEEFLGTISARFTVETYNLLNHNCNTFTQECAQFLTGRSIPAYIQNLPEEFLQTQLGQMLRPMLERVFPPSHHQNQSQSQQQVQNTFTSTPTPPPSSTANSNNNHHDNNHSSNVPSPVLYDKCTKLEAMLGKLREVLLTSVCGRVSDQQERERLVFLELLEGEVRDILREQKGNREGGSDQENVNKVCGFLVKCIMPTSNNAIAVGNVFPLMDVIRILVLRRSYFEEIFYSSPAPLGVAVIASFAAYSSKDWPEIPVQATITALKVAANSFAHKHRGSVALQEDVCDLAQYAPLHPGASSDAPHPSIVEVLRHATPQKVIVSACVRHLLSDMLSLRRHAATLAFNLGVTLAKDDQELTMECVSALAHAVTVEKDLDTELRLLMALQHFFTGNKYLCELAEVLGVVDSLALIRKDFSASGKSQQQPEAFNELVKVCAEIEKQIVLSSGEP
eukprot:Nk52_evm17s24 gene=Nk52_evmTU17s24